MYDKKRCKVLGYNVDLMSFRESVTFVMDKMENNEGLHIVTINPEIIAQADKNSHLATIINNSELVIPDSTGIKTALKLKGIKQEQIPGVDFAKELIKKCSKMCYPIALVGAKEQVITKTVTKLKKEFPLLEIVYVQNGYYKKEIEVINNIAKTHPKLVLCALGSPKQEIFIDDCRKIFDEGVYIGVGGSFDVWSGEVKRAPEIFQKLGLEWLYRTLNQPSRIKRIYKTLPMFLFRAIIDSMRK